MSPERFKSLCSRDLQEHPRSPLPDPDRIISKDFASGCSSGEESFYPEFDPLDERMPALLRRQGG